MQPIVAIYILWLLWFLSWLAAAAASSRSDHKLSTLQNIAYSLIVMIGGLLMFGVTPAPGLDVQYRLWASPKGALGWLAVGLTVLAFCIAWWAVIRRSFRRENAVVETGPYRFVRHPIYASLMIASFSTAAVFGRPSSMAGAVLMSLAFVIRIVVEERMLRDDDAAYDEYADRVPMLLPFLPTGEMPLSHAQANVAPPVVAAVAPQPQVAATVEQLARPTLVHGTVPVEPVAAEEDAPAEIAPVASEEDEEIVSDLGVTSGTVTTKPIQLSLALDDADEEDALERTQPALTAGATKS